MMPAKPRRLLKAVVVIASLTAAFLIALALDVPVSTWAHESGLAGWLKNEWYLTHGIRIPGHFTYTLVAGVWLLAAAWAGGSRRGSPLWKKPAIVLLAGIFSGINAPLKWAIGRIRPFHGVPPFVL